MEAADDAEANEVFVQRELLLQHFVVSVLADRDFELCVLLNALDNGLSYSSIFVLIILSIVFIAILHVLHLLIVRDVELRGNSRRGFVTLTLHEIEHKDFVKFLLI